MKRECRLSAPRPSDQSSVTILIFELHESPVDRRTNPFEFLVFGLIETRFLLSLATKINGARLAQVRGDHTAFFTDEAERVFSAFEFNAFARRLFFDVLANAVFACAAALDTVATLIKSEIVERFVKLYFAGVEMLVLTDHDNYRRLASSRSASRSCSCRF